MQPKGHKKDMVWCDECGLTKCPKCDYEGKLHESTCCFKRPCDNYYGRDDRVELCQNLDGLEILFRCAGGCNGTFCFRSKACRQFVVCASPSKDCTNVICGACCNNVDGNQGKQKLCVECDQQNLKHKRKKRRT